MTTRMLNISSIQQVCTTLLVHSLDRVSDAESYKKNAVEDSFAWFRFHCTTCCGVAWHGMAWLDMAQYGLACRSMAWHGMARAQGAKHPTS